MMASGFFLFFAVLGALAMIVWLIVGISPDHLAGKENPGWSRVIPGSCFF